MENLFCQLQSDKKFHRHVSILRYVNNISHGTTMELAEQLGCSAPTIREDIAYLNEELSALIHISSSIRGDIQFENKNDVSMESIMLTLAKQTLVFQIIDSLFRNRQWTVEQAAMHLLTSKTTLLRNIRHMNVALEKFQISIQTTNMVCFVGREEDIRVFLFAFFSYFGDSTIICNTAEDIGQTMIEEGFRNMLTPLHFSHFRVGMWLSILAVRWHYKHFVHLSSNIRSLVHNQEERDSFAAILQKFYRAYHHVSGILPEDEVTWLYLASIHAVSYSDADSHSFIDYIYKYRRPETPEIVEEARSLLAQVFSAEVIASGAVEKLEAYLINSYILETMTPTFNIVAPQLKEMAQNMYGPKFSRWYEVLNNLPEDSVFQFLRIKDIVTNLTIMHSAMRIEEKERRVRVIFSFQGEAGFDEYLAKISRLLINEFVDAEYYLDRSITEEVIEEEIVDLVVCNYDLLLQKSAPCPIIRLGNIPTFDDWGKVRCAVIQLRAS